MSPENQTRLDVLRSAPPNAWIAISEDESRIIAVGADFGEVSDKADEAGEPDAIILKTPPVWSAFSV
jgi:hypothetical protein